MNKNFRIALLCLLLPVCVGAFYLESKLTLSTTGHTQSQILILLIIFWLVWRWLKYDEACYLWEYVDSKPVLITYRIISTSEFRVVLNEETNVHQPAKTTKKVSPLQGNHQTAGNGAKFFLKETVRKHWSGATIQHNKS